MRRDMDRKAAGEMETVSKPRGFTLVELLLVIALIAVVILALAPALHAAAGRSKSQVCLANLRSLGVAVRSYAEQCGTLPGPLWPSVYHSIEQDFYPYEREHSLLWVLQSLLGETINDRLVTCPTMGMIVPDSLFEHFYQQTGRFSGPAHYALNNVGVSESWPDGLRTTNPPCYFGWPRWPGPAIPPVAFDAVANAEREWMIADAWYRPRVNPNFPELQQEGPYQDSWTGAALPNFAPHERRASRNYLFISEDTRNAQSARIRQNKSDGITNTLFFDGHAAAIPSRSLRACGFELLYGFPGTVNPHTPLPEYLTWR